jgi:hypothetical protein
MTRTPMMASVSTPLVARLTISGTRPLSSLVWSMMMRNAPIARPDPTAIRSPRVLGRTTFWPGMNPTSTTATTATPRPAYPTGDSVSPSTSSPQSIGAIAETTAVRGERMLIGPIARHAYSSTIATTPVTPESAPHAMSAAVHSPPMKGRATLSITSPEAAATAVTTIERRRFAASPPKKSAAPYTKAPARARAAENMSVQHRESRPRVNRSVSFNCAQGSR